GVTWQATRALLSWPQLDRLSYLGLEGNPIGPKAFAALRGRLGDRLDHELCDAKVDAAEVRRRVEAQPPRCVRGLGAKPDTELIRRFPRDRIRDRWYPCVSFELTHPDPEQRATLLGYDGGHVGAFLSPWA